VESNWRWNVWECGMWGSDWLMCARVLNPAPYYEVFVVNRGDGISWEYYTTGPGQIPSYGSSVSPPPWAPHFPYGVAVHPD